MKCAVAGAGLMGRAIAKDLSKDPSIDEITVIDIDESRLTSCVAVSPKIKPLKLDVEDIDVLANAIEGHDVVAGALLHRHSPGLIRSAIKAGVSLVDLVGSEPELRLAMHDDAVKAGITIIPGFGLEPGLSNMLAGVGIERLARLETVRIFCGGIPRSPQPPLGYRVVFALESVLNACMRPARIVRDGVPKTVRSLSEVEEVVFRDPVGRCEAFIMDGLSTLAITIPEKHPEVKEVISKTVRYPGYAEKINFLIECGLFSDQPVKVNDCSVVPRKFLENVLRPVLSRGDERDITVLRVEVTGRPAHSHEDTPPKRVRYTFEIIDLYDEVERETSMARTTGYTCAIGCRLVMKGRVKSRGVVPVEHAFTGDLYETVKSELLARGIVISEKIEALA